MRRLPGEPPEWVDDWTPAVFKKVGAALVVGSAALFPLAMYTDVTIILPTVLSVFTAGYWKIGASATRT